MGKNQSKTEEIIIAQNGANSASPRITDVETRVDSNFLILMVLLAGVVLLYLNVFFQLYKRHMRKLFNKDLAKATQNV